MTIIALGVVDHHYTSTGCVHGEHIYCASTTRRDGGPKVPAQCKWCAAPCVCPCHAPSTFERDQEVTE